MTLYAFLVREDVGWMYDDFIENYAVIYSPYGFISPSQMNLGWIDITFYPLTSKIIQIENIKIIQQICQWLIIHHLLIILLVVVMIIPKKFLKKKYYLSYYLNNVDLQVLKILLNHNTKKQAITIDEHINKKEFISFIQNNIFTMKNYLFSLIKIKNENTRKFTILSEKIDDYLSIDKIVKTYKENEILEKKKNKINWFIKTFDLFSKESYFFFDIYDKTNKKINIFFLLLFCSLIMFTILGFIIYEIFYLKLWDSAILNTAIGEMSDMENFHYSVPMMIIVPQFFANYTRLTNIYLLNDTCYAINKSCTQTELEKFNVTLGEFETSLCFDLFDVAGIFMLTMVRVR